MDQCQEVETLADLLRNLEEINLPLIALVVVAGYLTNVLIERGLPWLSDRLPSRFRLYILPLGPVLRLIVFLVGFGLIIPEIINVGCISPQNVLAILGAAAVALGFAFKDLISSIIAGVVTIFEMPYRAGDWVEIDGDYGEVTQVGLRAVKILTPDDTVITIPHQKLWDQNIANSNDGRREHMVVADFYLEPRHEAAQVRQLLWDVAMTSPFTHLSRNVIVVLSEKPWGTHYRLKAYPIDGRDEFQFRSDLTVRGKKALSELGVAAASVPIYALGDEASL